MNDKLIEELKWAKIWWTRKVDVAYDMWVETCTRIVNYFLSSKVILDKQVLEWMIEKYKIKVKERNAPVYTMVNERLQDLTSLLPKETD